MPTDQLYALNYLDELLNNRKFKKTRIKEGEIVL